MVRIATTLLLPLALACASLVVACSDDAVGQSESAFTDEGGRQLTPDQVALSLVKAGFTAQNVPRMVCIAWHESEFFEGAERKNANHSTSSGLFMINSVNVANTPGCPTKVEQLLNADVNSRCAFAIYGMLGFRGFPAYVQNKAECDAYQIAVPRVPVTPAAGDAGAQR